MNPEQLKNSILQFALQGKLTDLEFSQSKDRRHFLSTKHEISNFNSTADEELFEIPHHWTWAKLKDISQYIKAGGDKPKNFSIDKTDKHNVPVIANGKKNKGIVGYTEESKISDVCLTISGRGTIGYTEIREEPFVPIVRLIVVSPLPNVSIHYLKYYLNAFLAPSVGTSIPQLTIPMIKEKSIALPPLEEQKKIVEKLDFIFNVVDKYEKSYTLLLNLQKSFPNQLEKSILQYAIEGKLVEQDTSDEPTLELLKRISEQKQQMVKKKIIKKEKILPAIDEEEIPFDIPTTWEWVRLREVALITMGQSPEGTSVGEDISGIEFHQGKSLFSKMYLSKSNQNTHSPKKIANPHSIIMSVRAPVGDVNILKDRSICIGRGLASIEPVTGIDLYYLNYYLKWAKPILESKSTGSTFKAVNLSTISSLIVPLPPTNEQIRIVKEIENMSNSIRNLSLLNER